MTVGTLVGTPDPPTDPPKFNLYDRVTVSERDSAWFGEPGVVTERKISHGQHVYMVRIDSQNRSLAFVEAELRATGTPEATGVTLNPEDPFEAVIIDIVETNRSKRRDYALDTNVFSNFEDTSRGMGIEGFSPSDSALFNVHQKLARLRSLRANGRLDDPANESVEDTYLDLAVYAVIAYAIRRFPTGSVNSE